MRQAFEWGEITWEEFWTHKESLYRILLPFNPGYVTTERITPADIDPAALASFRALEGRFPYELKRQQLELGWEHAVLGGSKDAANAERQYREFMMRFGSRFANRAA